jgi:hypothetical protein
MRVTICVLISHNFSNVPIMDNIIEPTETFDFSKLSLALPTSIPGGAYFTKIHFNSNPLYIQTPKSLTKQGIVKSGKKINCDLMFDNNAEIFIRWCERLEQTCQELIYEKSAIWFQSTLEKNDIEDAFNSLIKVYKSGKFYLLHTNIKNNNVTNIPIIKIYNENENILSIDDVKQDSNIISIIEIQGIKFTSYNFQIEIELKQIMLFNTEPFFETCLIKTNYKSKENEFGYTNTLSNITNIKELEKDILNELQETSKDLNNNNNNNDKSLEEIKDTNLEELDLCLDINSNNNEINLMDIKEEQEQEQEENLDFIVEDLDKNLDLDIDEINNLKEVEINVSLDNPLETITLKKPNEVYYEVFKEARNKAKIAKKNAIIAYLEAKNIKKTYMLEHLDYSDNDIDNEIENVSESELERL